MCSEIKSLHDIPDRVTDRGKSTGRVLRAGRAEYKKVVPADVSFRNHEFAHE